MSRFESKLQAAGARENAPELFQHQAPARVHGQLVVNVMRSGLALQLKAGSQTRDVEQRRLRIIRLPELCQPSPAAAPHPSIDNPMPWGSTGWR